MTARAERRFSPLVAFATGALVALVILGATNAHGQDYPPPTMPESGPVEHVPTGPDYQTPENLPADTLLAEVEKESTAIVKAVDQGDWWMAAALVLSLAVWLARKGAARFLPDGGAGSSKFSLWLGRLKRWTASGEGGVVLTILGAGLTGLLTVLASQLPFGWVWLSTTLKVGLASMGGFVGLKKTLSRAAVVERQERRETTDQVKAGMSPAPTAPLVLALLMLLPGAAFAQAQLVQVTAAQTGLSGAILSGSPQTAAISMLNPAAPVSYNQLTIGWVAVVGTSTAMTVTCTGSVDLGTTYKPIERCSDGTTFSCTAATWSYDLTTQTSGLINIPTNYTHMKCVFTATGTGTVTVTGVKNTV